MPIYEFLCQRCDERFELRRPMADAHVPATCAHGHDDVVRLLPVFATIGSAADPASSCGQGSGCCGGACGSA
jgi:putative FmdB family regulatory protein